MGTIACQTVNCDANVHVKHAFYRNGHHSIVHNSMACVSEREHIATY